VRCRVHTRDIVWLGTSQKSVALFPGAPLRADQTFLGESARLPPSQAPIANAVVLVMQHRERGDQVSVENENPAPN